MAVTYPKYVETYKGYRIEKTTSFKTNRLHAVNRDDHHNYSYPKRRDLGTALDIIKNHIDNYGDYVEDSSEAA